jgi:hypothetical protein
MTSPRALQRIASLRSGLELGVSVTARVELRESPASPSVPAALPQGVPALARSAERLTVDCCANQTVPGSIPGGRTLLPPLAMQDSTPTCSSTHTHTHTQTHTATHTHIHRDARNFSLSRFRPPLRKHILADRCLLQAPDRQKLRRSAEVRDRTEDLQIFRLTLSPLSYRGRRRSLAASLDVAQH